MTEITESDLDAFVEERAIGNINKGAFHRWLGKKEGEPITAADIAKGLASDDPHVKKMAQFAKNAKQFNSETDENEDRLKPGMKTCETCNGTGSNSIESARFTACSISLKCPS
jgi:ABC-type Zn2+ transport system substrate-binding protein/surface adhesin